MNSRLKPRVKLPTVGVKRNEGVNDPQLPNHQQATKQNLNNQDAFNQVYRDLSQPGSFTTKIQKYLRSNHTHSIHQPRRKKFKRRRIITHYPSQIIQMDLIELRNISGSNYGYNYILLVIDCFSKKIWLRKLKTKTGKETTEAIKSVIMDMNLPPQTVIFDEGLEFYNKHVSMLFLQFNIHCYSIKTS